MFDFDVEATVADLRHARATTGRAYTVLLLADGEARLEVSAWEALPADVAIGSRVEARVVVRSRQSGGRYWTDAVAMGVKLARPLPAAPRQRALFAEEGEEAEKPAAAATPATQPCTADATGASGAAGESFADYRSRRMREAFGSRENQWRNADA